MIMIVYQKFTNEVDCIWELWYQLSNSGSLYIWKIKFHMTCNFLELSEQLLLWCTKNVMDLVYLVKLISSRKEGCKRQNFKEYATNTPVVHFMIVVPIG